MYRVNAIKFLRRTTLARRDWFPTPARGNQKNQKNNLAI
jgi:hypothetical protein